MNTLHEFPWRQRASRGAVVLLTLVAMPAWALDWSRVDGTEITLFFPGQTSWEWLLTAADHPGAGSLRGGKSCPDCHTGEEKTKGSTILSDRKLTPHPIPGMQPWLPLNVKTAHDGERIFVRLEWSEPGADAKAAVMLEDGHAVEAARGGCWGVCHDDMLGMPSAPEGKSITKYLAASRTKLSRQGGDEYYQPQAKLDNLLRQGKFYEYWQARLKPGAPAEAVDGYVLEKRHENPVSLVRAEAERHGGRWAVVFSRALKPADSHHKAILPGKSYFLGIAVHGAGAAHRFHHVSFGHTLALDRGEADFIARKQ